MSCDDDDVLLKDKNTKKSTFRRLRRILSPPEGNSVKGSSVTLSVFG